MNDVTLINDDVTIARLEARLSAAFDTGDSLVEQNKLLWKLVLSQRGEIEKLRGELEAAKGQGQ